MVIKDKHNEHSILLQQTQLNAYIIKLHRGARRVVRITNSELKRYYIPTIENSGRVAELWLNSPIQMTEMVKKELEMQIVISRAKIIAKLEEGQEFDLPKGAVIVTEDSLEGKSMKELVKIYNAAFGKEDRVKVIPDAEGDIGAATVITWATISKFEIPEKTVKVAREEKTYASTGKAVEDGVAMPTQARVIITVLGEAGSDGLKKSALVEAITGKVESKQPLDRIVSFYQKRLVDEGYVTMS